MMHYTTHNNKEYYIIQTTFEAAGIQVPVQIRISLIGLNEQKKQIIHRNAAIFLNRPLKITPTKPQENPTQPKKSWWKIW